MGAANAQETKSYSPYAKDQLLEARVAEVLANNQNIQAAAAQIDAAAALAKQAGAALKPTVRLAAKASSTDVSGLSNAIQQCLLKNRITKLGGKQ